MRDNLLLPEVDAELAAMPVQPVDDSMVIRTVQVTAEWTNYRQQFANDMYAEYLVRHAELEME